MDDSRVWLVCVWFICVWLVCMVHLCVTHVCMVHLCVTRVCMVHLCVTHVCMVHLCVTHVCMVHLCVTHLSNSFVGYAVHLHRVLGPVQVHRHWRLKSSSFDDVTLVEIQGPISSLVASLSMDSEGSQNEEEWTTVRQVITLLLSLL